MVKSIRKSAYNYPLYNMYILILSKLKLAGQGLSDEIDTRGVKRYINRFVSRFGLWLPFARNVAAILKSTKK
jgi:hypothetical protein